MGGLQNGQNLDYVIFERPFCDYAMKLLPRKGREKQEEFFGKKAHCAEKISNEITKPFNKIFTK